MDSQMNSMPRTVIQRSAGLDAVEATIPQNCSSSRASQGTESEALKEHVERMDVEIYPASGRRWTKGSIERIDVCNEEKERQEAYELYIYLAIILLG